jgi:hypothetical protein
MNSTYFSEVSVPTPESDLVKLFPRIEWVLFSYGDLYRWVGFVGISNRLLSASSIVLAIWESRTANESSSTVRWSVNVNETLFCTLSDWERPRIFAAVEFSAW